jgi:hypothetical protein
MISSSMLVDCIRSVDVLWWCTKRMHACAAGAALFALGAAMSLTLESCGFKCYEWFCKQLRHAGSANAATPAEVLGRVSADPCNILQVAEPVLHASSADDTCNLRFSTADLGVRCAKMRFVAFAQQINRKAITPA